MAVRRICADRKPDLVLSGVNSGQNVADDVTYSGTIAGAIEGTLLGISSIALSQAYPHGERARIPYETSIAHAPGIIRKLLDFGFPENIVYNVNFPNRAPDEIGGVMITSQGKLDQASISTSASTAVAIIYVWPAYRRRPRHRPGLGPAGARARRGLGDGAPSRHDRLRRRRPAPPSFRRSRLKPKGRCTS